MTVNCHLVSQPLLELHKEWESSQMVSYSIGLGRYMSHASFYLKRSMIFSSKSSCFLCGNHMNSNLLAFFTSLLDMIFFLYRQFGFSHRESIIINCIPNIEWIIDNKTSINWETIIQKFSVTSSICSIGQGKISQREEYIAKSSKQSETLKQKLLSFS